MGKEKIIKQQSRSALQGNLLVLIAGVGVIFTLIFALYYLLNIPLILTDAINPDTDEVYRSKYPVYYISLAGITLVSILLSPFVNGFLKAAANTAVNKSCGASDLLYYFSGAARYFKTIVLNMLLFIIVGVLTAPPRMIQAVGWFQSGEPAAVAASIALTAVNVVWTIFVYAWFAHYPLCCYALDDSRASGYYAFGLIGFSFRNFGNFIRLLISFIGWIALCFFVAPAIYVIPYMAVSMMTSAKWLCAKNAR